VKPPTVFIRRRDAIFLCVVRTTAGRPVMRSTGCRIEGSARQYADLLQRDIIRRAAMGDLLPPPKSKAAFVGAEINDATNPRLLVVNPAPKKK